MTNRQKGKQSKMTKVNMETTEEVESTEVESTSAKAAHVILGLVREVLMLLTAITVGMAYGAFAGILTFIGLLLLLSMSIIKSTGKDIIVLAACGDPREELKKAERKTTDISTFIMLLVYIGTKFLCG